MTLEELLTKNKRRKVVEFKFEVEDILTALKTHAPEVLKKEMEEEDIDNIVYIAKKALENHVFDDNWTLTLSTAIETEIG